MESKEVGKVKWFNTNKGFGFINRENDQEDIFVHYSAVRMEGFRMLKEGWKVEFMVIPSEKGALASDVEVISTNGDQITEAPAAAVEENAVVSENTESNS